MLTPHHEGISCNPGLVTRTGKPGYSGREVSGSEHIVVNDLYHHRVQTADGHGRRTFAALFGRYAKRR